MKLSAQCMVVGVSLLVGGNAAGQTVDLADPVGRQIVTGAVAGGRAGTWLDVGDVSGDISNRDLIVGTPDVAGARGEVRVLYGWVARTDSFSLSDFHVVIAGGAAGDRFGAATNAGFVTTRETRPWPTTARDLVVGAPGAFGGRGAVYLFAGPVLGPSLTTANAVFRVSGAAGDQLGTVLETADLNNDGYRELVLGAPGNGRVYVIDYHNAGVTSIDLATQAATVTITGVPGSGVGYVLAAGDVTADSIVDLAIGAPLLNTSAGAVYVINGRTGALPATINLAAGGANSTFAGFDPGDNAGTALWIRDVDGDTFWDLVITAQDAAGPGNTRPQSGEAYIVFGRAPQPAALAPNVTIYGAAAGHRLGSRVWIGGITRDTPDDMAFLARGANGGSGEGYVVYGRHRNEFPAVIDLATSADRRIISDETQGQLETMVVWGVTPEGADDLVFGVPAADGGTGRLYFSISPTLSAEAQGGATGAGVTVNIIVNPGQRWTTPIALKNRTNIPVSWVASTGQTWLSLTPTSGVSTASQDGMFFITASAQGLSSGMYQGYIRVATTTTHLDTTVDVTVNMLVASPTRDPADFNGDGTLDLVWQHQTSGALAYWRMSGWTMQGADPLNPGQITDLNWRIVGTGDFNGDAHPDLLWHHQTDGFLAVWIMNGPNQVSAVLLTPDRVGDTNWRPVATGDFNGDGKRDIVWHHQTQGYVGVWLMDGTRLIDGIQVSDQIDSNWKVVAAGDFNGDGRTDLLWRNQSNGKIAVWLMDGLRLAAGVALTPDQVGDTNWQIRGVGDVNRDGKPDLLWQHATSGNLAVWLMNGTVLASGIALTPGSVADLNWKIVGPR